MKNYMEFFWKVNYSDHHTILVGATVTAWFSKLIFQHEIKLSLLEEMLALLILLPKILAQESYSKPQKFLLSPILL